MPSCGAMRPIRLAAVSKLFRNTFRGKVYAATRFGSAAKGLKPSHV